MQIGMMGLGRMGASMARRLVSKGHHCVVHDVQPAAMSSFHGDGVIAAASLDDLLVNLKPPRTIWMMVPAAVVDAALNALTLRLTSGDIVIDGGNSYCRDDVRRAQQIALLGCHYTDVGTSGGVAGEDRGYCLMIGGESPVVKRLSPIFSSLAPGASHCVKIVHNGIEYGVMATYAEGFDILKNASVGKLRSACDAETAPLRDAEFAQCELNQAAIAELWRGGCVIGSWLLDLTARALLGDPKLAAYDRHVSDSGEGRWSVQAAIDEAVAAPVLSADLYARFVSRGNAQFSNRLLSAMRHELGGHIEKTE